MRLHRVITLENIDLPHSQKRDILPPVVWNSGEAVAGIGKEKDNRLLSRQNEWKSECAFRETLEICCGDLCAIVFSTDSLLSKNMDIWGV